MIPEQMIAAIPTKYALGATHGAPPKIAPAIRAMIGSFAPHGIKVVVMMVILTVTVVLDGSGSHDTRNAASGTDQHRDEGFTGKTKFTEDTVHDKCNTSHVSAALKDMPGR